MSGFRRLFNFGRRQNTAQNIDLTALEREFEQIEQLDIQERQHGDMNNVFITDLLKAYPVPLKNHNKVVLPSSLLKEIHDKKVWDNRQQDKPLIFELVVADPDTADVLEETHVGVDSFTAPPGKIGLPYKTALSLTKNRGVEWLHENPLISIRLVNVPSEPQCSMKVQPRGKGFFLEDESVVQLDIKTVLELTLKDHLVLTAGDWIPLFWDGNRFELVVQELLPNNIIDVLNTDLTVEMLPSEETEQSNLEKEKAEKRVKDFMEAREARHAKILEEHAGFKDADRKAKDTVSVRIRLPKGGNLTKTFKKSSKLQVLIDLVDLELYKKKFVPMHLPPENAKFFFNFIYVKPGKGKRVIETNKLCDSTFEEICSEFEITAKSFGFSLVMIKDEPEEKEEEKDEHKIAHINNEWLKMADRLEACLEENEEEEIDLLPQEEIDEIKAKLLAVGCDEELAGKVARLYGKQVNQLIGMGYQEQLPRAAALLNDKRGDLEMVMNALLM